MNNFYVYQHRRLDTNKVFYVGKGKGNRAYEKSKDKRSTHWHRIVNKHGYVVEFVDINLDEQTAFELEKFTIEFYGRKDLGLGLLVNFTDGGDGASGKVCSLETRIKLSASHFGKKFSSIHKEKLSIAGKNRSQEHRDKISLAHMGKTYTQERRLKMSFAMTGKRIGKNHPLFGKTGDKSARAKKVTNQCGEVFITITEAAKWCGLARGSHISACCKGKKKSAGKHPDTGIKLTWSYHE